MGPCRGQIAAVTRASPGPVISEKRTDLLIGMFNFDNMLDSRNFTSVLMTSIPRLPWYVGVENCATSGSLSKTASACNMCHS
jgi:hypothetical protein